MQRLIENLEDQLTSADEDTAETVRNAVSEHFSLKTNMEVTCARVGDRYVLRSFKPTHDGLKIHELPCSMSSEDHAAIMNRIDHSMRMKEAMRDIERLAVHVRQLVYGTVQAIQPDGSLLVFLSDEPGLSGVCAEMAQVPRERTTRIRGKHLPFYLTKVDFAMRDDIPRVTARLSRTSKGLVIELLRKAIHEKGIEAELTCTRRIAGAFSVIEATKRLPKECIRWVSNVLEERVVVTWRGN